MLASDIPIPEKVSRARLCEEDSESSEDNDTQEEEVVGHKSSVSSSASTLLDDDIEEVVSSAFNPPLDPRRYKGRALFSAGSSSGKSGPETECQSETVFRPLRRRPLSSSHVQDDMSQNSESASQAMIVQIPPTGILELPNSHENIQVHNICIIRRDP